MVPINVNFQFLNGLPKMWLPTWQFCIFVIIFSWCTLHMAPPTNSAPIQWHSCFWRDCLCRALTQAMQQPKTMLAMSLCQDPGLPLVEAQPGMPFGWVCSVIYPHKAVLFLYFWYPRVSASDVDMVQNGWNKICCICLKIMNIYLQKLDYLFCKLWFLLFVFCSCALCCLPGIDSITYEPFVGICIVPLCVYCLCASAICTWPNRETVPQCILNICFTSSPYLLISEHGGCWTLAQEKLQQTRFQVWAWFSDWTTRDRNLVRWLPVHLDHLYWTWYEIRGHSCIIHSSLKGVGGVLTSKTCHSKAGISVVLETQLFWNSIYALF